MKPFCNSAYCRRFYSILLAILASLFFLLFVIQISKATPTVLKSPKATQLSTTNVPVPVVNSNSVLSVAQSAQDEQVALIKNSVPINTNKPLVKLMSPKATQLAGKNVPMAETPTATPQSPPTPPGIATVISTPSKLQSPKAAQLSSGNVPMVVQKPSHTNFSTVAFYAGYSTNKSGVWLQTSHRSETGYTDTVNYPMNSQQVTQTVSYINPGVYFRLHWKGDTNQFE